MGLAGQEMQSRSRSMHMQTRKMLGIRARFNPTACITRNQVSNMMRILVSAESGSNAEFEDNPEAEGRMSLWSLACGL